MATNKKYHYRLGKIEVVTNILPVFILDKQVHDKMKRFLMHDEEIIGIIISMS